MPSSSGSPPLLSSLQAALQRRWVKQHNDGGWERALQGSSGSSSCAESGEEPASPQPQQPQQPQQQHHEALMMPEILLQVFHHLDTRYLSSSAALVCRDWHAVLAANPLWWRARCDARALAAVEASSAGSDSPTPLPLLSYALYETNLLRNPSFELGANFAVPPRRAAGAQFCPALLTSAQRKFAWVTTAGTPAWEQPPVGLLATNAGGTPPPPLPHPAAARQTSASSLAQLQQWLFGSSSSPPSSSSSSPPSSRASPACSTAGGSSSDSMGGSAAAAAAAAQGGAAPADQVTAAAAADEPAALSCLASSGSSWTEVVQVVDLMAALTQRGLDPDAAAAVLDSGALALGFSLHVAAASAPAAPAAAPAARGATAPCEAHAQAAAAAAAAGAQAGVGRGGARCAPQFAAALMLDDGRGHLRSFQTFIQRGSSHHHFSRRLALDPRDGWRRYAYLLRACPPGCRRAVVLLRGRGDGSAGSSVKFASAQLSFVRDAAALAEASLESFADRVVIGL